LALVARALSLDLSALPVRLEELRLRFAMGAGNNNRAVLLVYPAAEAGYEPVHIRFAVYMNLVVDGKPAAGNLGQLIVTGHRLIGMLTHGNADATKLDESAGSVFAFTIGLDDIQQPVPKTRWTGRVAAVTIASQPAQDPLFELAVTSVVGELADSGELGYRQSLADLIASLSPEARKRMQGPARH
jgi:hypothetical protein